MLNTFYCWLEQISLPLARFSLFLVYFWFGILKVVGLSSAEQPVYDLHAKTISFIPFHFFFIAFSLFECLIGVLFLVKGAEKAVFPLFIFHMITTTLPLVLLPGTAWSAPFVPTLIGQYIVKNIVLIAVAVFVVTKATKAINKLEGAV